MTEIRLSTGRITSSLITFDGRIIEYFSTQSRQGSRYHVLQIASIEIVTDKHGKNTLDIRSKYANDILMAGVDIRDEVLAEMQAFVAAVRQAMAAYA
jgi:hypothetical protein